MARQFITVDYAATLQQTVTLAECLPADHLARFIAGIIALLDLKTNPFQNEYQFHPVGLNMVHHTYNFFDGLLYALFRPWAPLLVFHNALTWGSVFANSLAAYLLLFSLTRLPAARALARS